MEYDLEISSAVAAIKKAHAKCVCIQLPDGLKPQAGEIATILEKQTGSTILIWAGSCFGSCDTPSGISTLGADMLISWGHSEWR